MKIQNVPTMFLPIFLMNFTIDLGVFVGHMHSSRGHFSHLRTSIIRSPKMVNFCIVQTNAHDNMVIRLVIEFILFFSHVD